MLRIDKVNARDILGHDNNGFRFGYEINEYDAGGDFVRNLTVEWFRTKRTRDAEAKKQEAVTI